MRDTRDLASNSSTELRQRAEARVRERVGEAALLTPDEVQRLLHELEVHRIELEMQNDELRNSREALEQSRDRYADLYDFAPIGYVTLDGSGVIQELNLKASVILQKERAWLKGSSTTRGSNRASWCWNLTRSAFGVWSRMRSRYCRCAPNPRD